MSSRQRKWSRFSCARLILIAALLASCGKSAHEDKATPEPLLQPETRTFKGTFGEQFRYKAPMELGYEPFGGMERCDFYWKSTHVGVLHLIAPLPPELAPKFPEYFMEKIGTTSHAKSVDYNSRTNPAGCNFYEFKADMEQDGKSYIYCQLYTEDPSLKLTRPRSRLQSRFGGIRIEFMIPRAEFDAMRPHLQLLFESFVPPTFGDH